MAQAHTVPAALPVQSPTLVFTAARAVAIPVSIWMMAAGILTTLVGATWDFSWHFSIGRDTFWTPPHILIQTGGILAGIASACAIIATTFGRSKAARDASVQVMRLRAPAGAFIALWGAIAMVASAPFDNWWHTAFGLDVKVVTPPHVLLSMGFFAVMGGAMAWMASIINRSRGAMHGKLTNLFLVVGSVGMAQLALGLMDPTRPANMHTAACYLAVAMYIPTWLIGCGSASAQKWGCTIVASLYTAIRLGAEWLLPLFPAQPKLGPVYHNVAHFIPLRFPLLLIVPAILTDLLLHRMKQQSSWKKALCVGPVFVLSFLAAQWPFADFLMSSASRNWFFGTAYFSYADPAGVLYDAYKYNVLEKTSAEFMLTMAGAVVAAIVATRLGLAWAGWMRRVRR